MTPLRGKGNRGFTLIELLVVIAIIAILAAILFPVFAKAREKARESSCLSNEKQIMTALNAYTQDYDERYPAQYNDGQTALAAGGTQGPTYYDALTPYIKSAQIWRCPDCVGPRLMSYHMSGDVITREGTSLAAVASPASCPAIRDAGTGSTYNEAHLRPYRLGQGGPYSTGCDDAYNSGNLNAGPHTDGGMNLGFCDGHTKNTSKRRILGFATFLIADSQPDCLTPP